MGKGKLYATINKEVSTWAVHEHTAGRQVQISLVKDVTGSQWPVPITGGLRLREDADPKSTFLLGQLTEGVLPKKTLELYRKSAKAGHLSAQLKLGHIYDVGQPSMVEGPNKKEALQWYMMAAAQGCLSAVFYSANFHFRGENKNHALGLPLYFEAISIAESTPLPPPDMVKCFDGSGAPQLLAPVSVADRNRLLIFVTACYLAGKILHRGSDDGIEAQPQKSRELWERAAEYNHAASLYSLGFLFLEGEGVAADPVEASRFFYLAWKIDPSFAIPDGVPAYPDSTQDSAYTSVSTTPAFPSQNSPNLRTLEHPPGSASPETETNEVSDQHSEASDIEDGSCPLEASPPATAAPSLPDIPANACSKDNSAFGIVDWVPTGLAILSGAALAGYIFLRQRN